MIPQRVKLNHHHKDQTQSSQKLHHHPIMLPLIFPPVILSKPHLLTSLLLTRDLPLPKPLLATLKLALGFHHWLLITRVILLQQTLPTPRHILQG